MKKFFYFFIFFLVFKSTCFSQTKQELEQERLKTLREIEYSTKLLDKTSEKRKAEINYIYLINRRIKLRESLLSNIEKEIVKIDTLINGNLSVISSLETDLRKLKEQYAKMIYYAYKNRSSYQKLSFILSSNSFNQAYKRIKYFQQYSIYRKKQANLIELTKSVLSIKNEELLEQKAEKLSLLEEKSRELKKLDYERTYKNKIVFQLKNKEKELQKQIEEKKRIADQIEKEIQKMLADELKEKGQKEKYKLTPQEQLVSDNFQSNKGRLPWPTSRGLVITHYGEYWHPVLKGVKMFSNGVDVETNEGSVIRSIFKGEVKKVFLIPGSNAAIIIRHGNYLSVYTNVVEVKVKPGDLVETKQELGQVFTDFLDDNKSIYHFELLKETERLNPELWLSNK